MTSSTLASFVESLNEARCDGLLHPNVAFVNAHYTPKDGVGDASDERRGVTPGTWLRIVL